jgi:putative FmdB family regulatory protein
MAQATKAMMGIAYAFTRRFLSLTMPIYEYACDTCGETVEVIHGISAPAPDTHQDCGGKLHRLMSAPTTRVKENDGMTGSTHSSMLRFQENTKIAAEKQRKK